MGEITEVIKGLIFPYICRHWYITTSILPQYKRIFEQIELFGIKLLFNPLTPVPHIFGFSFFNTTLSTIF